MGPQEVYGPSMEPPMYTSPPGRGGRRRRSTKLCRKGSLVVLVVVWNDLSKGCKEVLVPAKYLQYRLSIRVLLLPRKALSVVLTKVNAVHIALAVQVRTSSSCSFIMRISATYTWLHLWAPLPLSSGQRRCSSGAPIRSVHCYPCLQSQEQLPMECLLVSWSTTTCLVSAWAQ